MKILEAMALGCPVVSTAVGAEGLELRDGRDLLLGKTPGELADAAVRLLLDPAHARFAWRPMPGPRRSSAFLACGRA
jgi:glycosyltransferase involved in cell wall biosynthesis